MEQNVLEYNSLREHLIIPEYGRNVQKLVLHAKSIEDDAERQLYIERIVELIYQMNPQSKNVLEYRQRIWAHIFRIADFDLIVKPPEGVDVNAETALQKPQRVKYPENNRTQRHYGNNVKKLLAKAVSMEDGAKKDAFVQLIASFMKIAYKNWNREHYVNDEVIKSDIGVMTNGAIQLGEEFELITIHSTAVRRSGPKRTGSRGRSHHGRSKGGQMRRRSNNNNNGGKRRR